MAHGQVFFRPQASMLHQEMIINITISGSGWKARLAGME